MMLASMAEVPPIISNYRANLASLAEVPPVISIYRAKVGKVPPK
jgi:hypothetical protein